MEQSCLSSDTRMLRTANGFRHSKGSDRSACTCTVKLRADWLWAV